MTEDRPLNVIDINPAGSLKRPEGFMQALIYYHNSNRNASVLHIIIFSYLYIIACRQFLIFCDKFFVVYDPANTDSGQAY
jgi:hypothetical protein